MSPILGTLASQFSGKSFSSFESIQTVNVGSGGTSTVSFTSIPATYTHLQVRCVARGDGAFSDIDSLAVRFNGDTGNNYAYHSLTGNGTTASAGSGVSQPAGILGAEPSNTHTSGIFGGYVVDILDYTNTNKYKTIRALGGVDTNNTGSEKGEIRLQSTLWLNTSAINEITFKSSGGFNRGFIEYSQFALYGIKGA
jgi:hypothetical protein